MKLPYSVYIFDFDGTVAYTCEDVWLSIQYACEQCSIEVPEKLMKDRKNLALSSSELYRQFTNQCDKSEELNFSNLIRMHYRTLNTFPSTVLYPKMEVILKRLSKEADCFIASNKAEVSLKRLLKEKNWERYFKGIYGTLDEGGRTKTDIIHNLIEEYPDKLREEFVYIGDSCTDINAARQNQISSIGVTYGDGNSESLVREKPDAIVNTGAELYCLLFGG